MVARPSFAPITQIYLEAMHLRVGIFSSSNLLFLALVLGKGSDVMAKKNTQQPIFLFGAHDGRVRHGGEIGSFMIFFTEP